MGAVYEVEDVSVGKHYVLKTLHPQLVGRQDLAKRMAAEARALARLQHPNIVDVVTAGVTTDARRTPYYVMERLDGETLRAVLDAKGQLAASEAVRIAADLLDALDHAHKHGVVHRDVKPENIFLHNARGAVVTKLLDFGIMRLVDQTASQTQGKFIGTLRYASPEQIFGGEVGPASDVYSLGLVLYEMMAGRGPFDDVEEALAVGVAHAHRPPPALSTFAVVPVPLERLVMSMLEKEPTTRPRDAGALTVELRRLLDGGKLPDKAKVKPVEVKVVPRVAVPVSAGRYVATQIGLSPSPTDPEAPTEVDAASMARSRTAPLGIVAPAPLYVNREHDVNREVSRVAPANATGPLAGEARTRPPRSEVRWALRIVSGALALAVGALVVVVMRSRELSQELIHAPEAQSSGTTTAATVAAEPTARPAPAPLEALEAPPSPTAVVPPASPVSPDMSARALVATSASVSNARPPARPPSRGPGLAPKKPVHPGPSATSTPTSPPRPEDIGFE
jgi:tRNA A-37 threonylcarbamoyl transferase component Bud32